MNGYNDYALQSELNLLDGQPSGFDVLFYVLNTFFEKKSVL
jgi:hypothetical protein